MICAHCVTYNVFAIKDKGRAIFFLKNLWRHLWTAQDAAGWPPADRPARPAARVDHKQA